jgi:ubiquinone biosynthesis protein Coq4
MDVNFVEYLPKARIVKPAETFVARQWLSSHHVVTPTDMNTTVEELLEAVFCVQSIQMLYV